MSCKQNLHMATDEMIKKIQHRKFLDKYFQQSVEKMEFSKGQQVIIIYQTSRARQIRLIDKKKSLMV